MCRKPTNRHGSERPEEIESEKLVENRFSLSRSSGVLVEAGTGRNLKKCFTPNFDVSNLSKRWPPCLYMGELESAIYDRYRERGSNLCVGWVIFRLVSHRFGWNGIFRQTFAGIVYPNRKPFQWEQPHPRRHRSDKISWKVKISIMINVFDVGRSRKICSCSGSHAHSSRLLRTGWARVPEHFLETFFWRWWME